MVKNWKLSLSSGKVLFKDIFKPNLCFPSFVKDIDQTKEEIKAKKEII